MEKSREKSLDIIQTIIGRMGQNSFSLKSWTITIVTGVTVFISQKSFNSKLILILLIPVFFFCFLDAHYLSLERRFRHLYNIASNPNKEYIPFNLNIETSDFKKEHSLFQALLSFSVYGFYLPLAIIIIGFYLCL